jgi:hypothetical protein
MFSWERSKYKFINGGLLVFFLLAWVAFAEAHEGFIGGFESEGPTGYLATPGPVYKPLANSAPPQQMAQVYPGSAPAPSPGQTPPIEVPPPPPPSPSGYPDSAAAPTPGNQAKCREWKMIDRHFEDRWDSNSGKWRQVPIEKWDWVETPCDGKEVPPAMQGNVNMEQPPPYSFPAPPEMAVIPGTYVYMVPNIGVEILFYQGAWYRPFRGHWFWGRSYNGPWVYLTPNRLPRVFLELPPGYRRLPPGYHHIPYSELHANWRRWEQERYWHNDRRWREGGRRP